MKNLAKYEVFSYFMSAYWNQFSMDFYSSFEAATEDFKEKEGNAIWIDLKREIINLHKLNIFYSENDLEAAREKDFWSQFQMIVTIEDIDFIPEIS